MPTVVRGMVVGGVALASLIVYPGPVSAQKLLADGILDLAAQIASGTAQQEKSKIAVLPFRELNGSATVLGTYVAEELVTALFAHGKLDIVERTMLDKVMAELKLNESGAIDPATAKQVGQLAGVDAIVTGTITDLQSQVALNCRLIDTQTGRIFGAAQTKIIKDDDVRKIMGVPLAQASTPPAGAPGSADVPGQPSGPTPESRQPDAPGTPIFEAEDYRLVVQSVKQGRGNTIEVAVLFESLRPEPIRVQKRCFYMLDENGDRWDQADCRTFASEFIELPPGTKIKKEYSFRTKGPGSGRSFSLIGNSKVKVGRQYHDASMTLPGLGLR